MLTIFDVSIENQKIYGILQIEIFPQQKSHIITGDIFVWYGVTMFNIQ